METVSISAVDFSLTLTQVRIVKRMNRAAMMIEKYLKPTISIILAPASEPANILPSIGTSIIVKTVTIALPTPALVRAMVVRFSRSRPPSVKAGIMDQ